MFDVSYSYINGGVIEIYTDENGNVDVYEFVEFGENEDKVVGAITYYGDEIRFIEDDLVPEKEKEGVVYREFLRYTKF